MNYITGVDEEDVDSDSSSEDEAPLILKIPSFRSQSKYRIQSCVSILMKK